MDTISETNSQFLDVTVESDVLEFLSDAELHVLVYGVVVDSSQLLTLQALLGEEVNEPSSSLTTLVVPEVYVVPKSVQLVLVVDGLVGVGVITVV